MPLVRTIINLDSSDKSWLDRKAQQAGVPMAELVRRAVRRLRQEEEGSFDKILKQTSGLWRQGDGLAYQRRVREQWR